MSVFRWLCCCCRCGWLFGLGDARKWPWIYRKFPFIFQYKSIKYIKVDVAHVCLLHRFLQVAMMMLALASYWAPGKSNVRYDPIERSSRARMLLSSQLLQQNNWRNFDAC